MSNARNATQVTCAFCQERWVDANCVTAMAPPTKRAALARAASHARRQPVNAVAAVTGGGFAALSALDGDAPPPPPPRKRDRAPEPPQDDAPPRLAALRDVAADAARDEPRAGESTQASAAETALTLSAHDDRLALHASVVRARDDALLAHDAGAPTAGKLMAAATMQWLAAINDIQADNGSSLQFMAAHGYDEAVSLMIEAGADVNSCYALAKASAAGHIFLLLSYCLRRAQTCTQTTSVQTAASQTTKTSMLCTLRLRTATTLS